MADESEVQGDAAAPESSPDEVKRPADDVEYLLQQAEDALKSVEQADDAGPREFSLPELGAAEPTTEHASLELLRDVELDLRIELGRTRMHLEDVLQLGKGAVVPLDKLAGDPVDVFVNGRLIARGEVLVLNDSFCVRVTELVSGHEFSAG